MKILISPSSVDTLAHARSVIKKIAEQDANPMYGKQANPIGIATHMVKFPTICDDCGLTFWATEPYSSHLGCNGYTKNTGF